MRAGHYTARIKLYSNPHSPYSVLSAPYNLLKRNPRGMHSLYGQSEKAEGAQGSAQRESAEAQPCNRS
ncbi:hypothetical protein FGO68_gene2835 [Halteria grandinella]|uniref:Uncharacterized protein n=1 Tax=Halteria grandinella TaxID=5974 RepID=A0A8J8NLZ7_HALGN|nr:hypothetical protein FGO68_gene2835 [Halteria grandinella]